MPQVGSKSDGRGRKKKHPWFRPTLVYSHRKRHYAAIRMQKWRGRMGDEITIPSPPPLATRHAIRKQGRKAVVAGREILLYGLGDLARIYGWTYHKFGRWYANGMLPDPFTTRRQAGADLPLWTFEQAEAICLVLNDLFRQGCTHYTTWHHAHIRMMQEGGRYALRYLDDPGPSLAQVRREISGKHGVVWTSGPYVKEGLPALLGWDEPRTIIQRKRIPGAAMTSLFPDQPDDRPPKPKFKPFHPDFTGTVQVLKSIALDPQDPDNYHEVNLDTGICSCEHGADYFWYAENRGMQAKWGLNRYCLHKLRAIADIVERDPKKYSYGYTRAIATRYNRYETVSVFHKELRRGDVARSVYWGSILSTQRKLSGVLKYLLNTIYEETRDHTMHRVLVDLYAEGEPDYETVCKAIHLYCVSPKKWMLPHRLEIFESEMRGYHGLAKLYGWEVAGHSGIIPSDQIEKLSNELVKGFARGDRDQVQRGVKGLFKMKPPFDLGGFEDLKLFILELLADVRKGKYPNAFDFDGAGADRLHDLLMRKRDLGIFHYHEINAYADLLCGEPFGAGCTTPQRLRGILVNPTPPTMYSSGAVGKIHGVPVYAHDNHTWEGKGLLRRFPHEIKPHVPQDHMDLRLCGAYHGVAWRYLAWKQHGTIDIPWQDVKWPQWMAAITQKMFY